MTALQGGERAALASSSTVERPAVNREVPGSMPGLPASHDDKEDTLFSPGNIVTAVVIALVAVLTYVVLIQH
jgi:hypothetical protein